MTRQPINLFSKRAILVKFTQHRWTPVKEDKGVSKEVAVNKSASKYDAGAYRKNLIVDKKFAQLQGLISETYTYHITMTVPYMYRGMGMLPIGLHREYSDKMREFTEKLAQLKREVREELPAILQREKESGRLGEMWDEKDYDLNKMVNSYSFNINFYPVPESGHFVVDASKEEIDELQRDFHESEKEAIQEATKDLWGRLFGVVENMVNRLSDPKGKFKDTLVGNIDELCDLLPKLNIAEDSTLNKMTAEIKNRLTQYEPETLRTDTKARKETAKNAAEILGQLKGFIN